jgi:hypothetical protein
VQTNVEDMALLKSEIPDTDDTLYDRLSVLEQRTSDMHFTQYSQTDKTTQIYKNLVVGEYVHDDRYSSPDEMLYTGSLVVKGPISAHGNVTVTVGELKADNSIPVGRRTEELGSNPVEYNTTDFGLSLNGFELKINEQHLVIKDTAKRRQCQMNLDWTDY